MSKIYQEMLITLGYSGRKMFVKKRNYSNLLVIKFSKKLTIHLAYGRRRKVNPD